MGLLFPVSLLSGSLTDEKRGRKESGSDAGRDRERERKKKRKKEEKKVRTAEEQILENGTGGNENESGGGDSFLKSRRRDLDEDNTL